MLSSWRCVIALAALPVVVAGCGDSPNPSGVGATALMASALGSGYAANPVASLHGATTCTVYESGYATQVIFDSAHVDVRPDCQAWMRVRAEPGAGYLWGDERTRADGGAGALTICYLADRRRTVTARVVEAGGFVGISRGERSRGASACQRMLAVGWVHAALQRPQPRSRRRLPRDVRSRE